MKGYALLSAIFLATIAPSAVIAAEPIAKLVLFHKAQDLCKATVLGSSELAENIVLTASGSLSELCECAAILSVSPLSLEEAEMVSESKERREIFQKTLSEALVRCVRIAPAP